MGHYAYAVVLISEGQWDRRPNLMSWNHVKTETLEDANEIRDSFREINMNATVVSWWVKDKQEEETE